MTIIHCLGSGLIGSFVIRKLLDEKMEINLGPRNFSYWSVDRGAWEIRGGTYSILIGSSSENILLQASINLEQVLEVL